MNDSNTAIYTVILAAAYNNERNKFDIDIHYQAEVPTDISANLIFDRYPIQTLADDLEVGNRETAFLSYSTVHDLAVDEALTSYVDETDDDCTSWMRWLEDNGYDEFIDALSTVTDQEDEAYLLVSRDELLDDVIRDEACAYLHDLKQQREQQQIKSSSGFRRRSF